jgi:hypothetical protein
VLKFGAFFCHPIYLRETCVINLLINSLWDSISFIDFPQHFPVVIFTGCGHIFVSVMGHVISIGLDLMGATRTTRLDSAFQLEIDNMLKLARKNHVTEREQKHVEAVRLWSEG